MSFCCVERRRIRLFGSLCHGGRGDDGDEGLVLSLLYELNRAVDESEEGVVFAHADISAGMMNCATLTNDDVASLSGLSSEELKAKSFAFRVASVLGAADAFFMCHFCKIFKL